MTRRDGRRPFLLLLPPMLGLALAASVSAQTPGPGVGAALRYESYSFASPTAAGASSVQLLTVPFAVRVALLRGLTLDASGAMARARVSAFGSSFSLSGLTDTEVRAMGTLERGRTALALAALGVIPSGHARLTLRESIVAGSVASDLLPFAVSHWGSGGGGGADVSAVHALEGGSVGVIASYRVAREFQPFDALDLAYRPGNEVRLGAAFERTLDDERTAAFQLAYSRFGEDQLQGRGWMRSGQRVLALGSYTMPAMSGTLSTYAGVLYRSGGALGEFLVQWSLWDMLARFAPPSETLVLLGSSARLPWHGRRLLPSADFRLLRRSDGRAQGLLLGVGGGVELPLGEGARLVPSARVRAGRLLAAAGAESGVTGFELGLALELGGAR